MVRTDIDNQEEQKGLLDKMFRCDGRYAEKWRERDLLELWFIGLPTLWTKIVLDRPIPWQYAEYWTNKHGEWGHGQGRTNKHDRLGMAYAWWIKEEQKKIPDLILSDSPDFHGTVGDKRINGDIGNCSFPGALDALFRSTFHSLWISVLDYSTQIIVEFNYAPHSYIGGNGLTALPGFGTREQFFNECFFCPECGKYSLDPKAIDYVLL